MLTPRLCDFKCNLETLAAFAASALGAATLLTGAENKSAFYSQAHSVFLLPRSKTSFICLYSFILLNSTYLCISLCLRSNKTV